MKEKDDNNNKPIAGVKREVFRTLPPEDQSFLSMLDRLGYDLKTLYRKATASAGKEK
jgi:hypothetical protein